MKSRINFVSVVRELCSLALSANLSTAMPVRLQQYRPVTTAHVLLVIEDRSHGFADPLLAPPATFHGKMISAGGNRLMCSRSASAMGPGSGTSATLHTCLIGRRTRHRG
ncbi:hypothetical protein [Streptomyces sp. NPDC014793]|uniref:hypothetical protein n=1 Tax=Streptomyces sp. NPDC014793 TaxID=3364914 RepID=UPI003701E359